MIMGTAYYLVEFERQPNNARSQKILPEYLKQKNIKLVSNTIEGSKFYHKSFNTKNS